VWNKKIDIPRNSIKYFGSTTIFNGKKLSTCRKKQLLLNFLIRNSYFGLLKVKLSETILLTFFGNENLGIERNKYFETFQGI